MSPTVETLALIVLAAGKGTRMKSDMPKVLHSVAGRPMVDWALSSGQLVEPEKVVIVVGPELEQEAHRFAPHDVVVQRERRGTGHAVAQARAALSGFSGHALVMYGDTPLVQASSIAAMCAVAKTQNAQVVLSVFDRQDGAGYGRVILDAQGAPTRIVEAKDANDEERAITTLNGGLMLVAVPLLWELLDQITDDNAGGEFYLTDLPRLAHQAGKRTAVAYIAEAEVQGVNTRVELAALEAAAQQRLRERAMLEGVTMVDPASVTMCFDTQLGQDVTIEPHVVFGPGVRVESGSIIRAFSHIEQTVIEQGCVVGPYARLRPGTVLRERAKIGNFVEVKNADFGEGAKANHLTYVGDAVIGAGSNIGAGTITCNYDGFNKSRTTLGEGVFIGSNSALVAPVSIGDGAMVGAGSVVTKDVPADAMAIGRSGQQNLDGRAAAFRRQASAKKTNKTNKTKKANKAR